MRALPAWFKKLRALLGAKPNRAFVWTCLGFSLLGFLHLAEPLDVVTRAARDVLRERPPSGTIALIMPDDGLDPDSANWSWSRENVGALVAELRVRGADRVAIARVITEAPRAADPLTEELKKMPGRSLVAMSFDVNAETGEHRTSFPPNDLLGVADAAVINQTYDGFGRVKGAPYRIADGKTSYRSLPSLLAGRDGGIEELARIDNAISLRGVPVVTRSSLRAPLQATLAGKTVVIASAEEKMNARGYGRVASAYAYILGAETLKAGRPIQIEGWLPLVIGMVFSLAVWLGGSRVALTAIAAATVCGLIVPFFLEQHLVFVETMTATILVWTVGGIRAYRNFRRAGMRENSLSGLPNLAALRDRGLQPSEAVVVAKICNYAELVSVVTTYEKILADMIAVRLGAGSNATLFHGDGGMFAWIVPEIAVGAIGDHLDALHAFFLKPVKVGSWQVDVSIAFGVDIAAAKDISASFSCALLAADEAEKRGARWSFYDPTRLDEAEWKVSLLGKLESAIESGEVWVAYQPQIDVNQGRVNGFEALVRWTHPERGAISPEQFVSVAESHGRIDRLTYFVLDEALAMLAALGPTHTKLTVAVNISPRMFGRPEFLPKVRAALKQHGIAPARLTMEITESAAAESEKDMLSCVAGMIRMGLQVSIDDYGTGYSTLEYLKTLKAHELKIDRSFIAGMDRNRSDYLLVKATIDLAHSLDHRIVAEGVETEEILEMLSTLGCDVAQGFLIARPMPRNEVEPYVISTLAKRAA